MVLALRNFHGNRQILVVLVGQRDVFLEDAGQFRFNLIVIFFIEDVAAKRSERPRHLANGIERLLHDEVHHALHRIARLLRIVSEIERYAANHDVSLRSTLTSYSHFLYYTVFC